MATMRNLFLGLALVFASATAHAAVISYDFDTVTAGTYTETDFSAMFGGVSFDNSTNSSFSVTSCSLLGDFTCGNAILNTGYSTVGNSTIATFDSLVDSVSVTIGDYNADADSLYLNAYDSANNLIASDFFANPSSSYNGYTLNVAAANIAYVEYYGVGLYGGNNVYWDNLSFNTQSVPEASTLLMLGFGLFGLSMVRRKKAA